jgi:integrase
MVIKPFLTQTQSKGKTYWYFRKGGLRTRIPFALGTEEFDRAYWKLRSGKATTRAPRITFEAVIVSYKSSPSFKRLKPGTREGYSFTLELIRSKNGPKDFTTLRRRDVIAARDAYADTWRKANSMVEMLSMLSRHAIDQEWITSNPAQGVEKFKGGEYEPWPSAVQSAFVRYCETHGLHQARLGFEMLSGLGQRIGDTVAMAWADFEDHTVKVVQEKTGEPLWVACPQKLIDYLATVPKQGRYVFAKNLTQHVEKRRLQKEIMDVRAAIGAEKYVPHGLRYTAAVELAEAGCSDSEIQSVTGHRTLQMVQKYRGQASRKKLSASAQAKRNISSTNRESDKPSDKPVRSL